METHFNKRRIALTAVAALGTGSLATAPTVAVAAKAPGQYVSGDFHNHTTCSDGALSMQKLVRKSTDKTDTPWGLDWFVQAGHGGNGNRNCTLVEDATLDTPVYPYNPAVGPATTWVNSGVTPAGNVSGSGTGRNMWRWQSVQQFQYPLTEYLSAHWNLPLFVGIETVVPGHEHTSMSVITGQIPASLDTAILPAAPGPATSPYDALGDATALAQWEYCFDRNDTDTSRGAGTAFNNSFDCSVAGSLNEANPSWNATGQKLIPAGGTDTGMRGHNKALESLKWMAQNHPNGSYYVPAHLERAGPFNPNGNNGFNIEHLRDFNNAAPRVAFGFETQPGHHASSNRGEYQVRRNNIGGVATDSVGGTTYGGTGIYGAQVGGVWDALLGEGRGWWFFASSDWHNRGSFGPDDRRSTQDFYPGEYQRDYVMVRNGSDRLRPETIVDGLRSGNSFAANGQLIDRLGFVACASYPGPAFRSNASVETLAVAAAIHGTDIDQSGCATMGEKLVVRPGAEIVVSIVARDPEGANYSPYSFSNPSLAQIGVTQPMNEPVLDHVDLILGRVTGYKAPGAADYSGEWPRNTDWLGTDGSVADLSVVPDAAKNTSAAVIRTFNENGAAPWTQVTSAVDGTAFLKMTYRIPAVTASQYVRLRGTNLPPAVPYETDADGNPLPDLFTNQGNTAMLRIPCTTAGSNVPANGVSWTHASGSIDGCPNHLPSVSGQKYVAYDVAAWADLWFYSNPIFVQVNGSTVVAGIN